MEELIRVENLSFAYETLEDGTIDYVLEDINLQVKQGEFLVVLGHNGSGKSTLAKLINAQFVPNEGNIWVKGINTREEETIWDIKKTCGMVFQNPDNQLVATIVEEDVAFGPENLGIPMPKLREQVDKALETVEMSEYKKHSPALLSGGQKQRIAIAGILAMDPECILLDEPTAMLDPSGRKEIVNTILKLNRDYNKTIVYITHYMEEAVLADRIIVISDKKIVEEGTPREIFGKVERMKELGLDVPQVTELAFLLRQEGYDIPNVLTSEELVEALCRLN